MSVKLLPPYIIYETAYLRVCYIIPIMGISAFSLGKKGGYISIEATYEIKTFSFFKLKEASFNILPVALMLY